MEIQESNASPWVGLDIGGANLKAAHSLGWSRSCVFPMWKEHRNLAISIAKLLDDCPAFCGVAVTMTGELADCFATRAQGVAMILEQITSVLPASLVRVYRLDGSWVTTSQAARDPWNVAAANWHALAKFATRFTGVNPSLLIDVGSTTTDIIPIDNASVRLEARTDSQRLQAGALVYTGVERSNIAGIVNHLTLFKKNCPVINELFATSRDVYLWLGFLEDEPNNCDTADNHPATRNFARYRLARSVGEDGSTLTDSDLDI
jgi:(4-(4-[2-(gamma-L-glutamylamino)ethyl]phenoxymethyl)furan-2-yl)methanamine synthase